MLRRVDVVPASAPSHGTRDMAIRDKNNHLGFRTGSGQTGLSQKCCNFHTFCDILFGCARFATNSIHVATCCHMFP